MNAVEVVRDFRGAFGPARDQGARQTCLALAASDLHAALRADGESLSAEFLFFHAQRRAQRSATHPSRLDALLDALREDGQPREAAWPYRPADPGSDPPWRPPADVGELYRRAGAAVELAAIEQILAWLDQDRPVIAGLTLSAAFDLPDENGVVDAPPWEVPEPLRRHAVIAVGYGHVRGDPALLVRNSWGPGWGKEGYGWLTRRFLTPRLLAAVVLEA